MNDFDYDVMIKKRVANSARNRKRGSKSKKCPMSTDHMTRKQWLERCGETVTYNLSKPMEWQDFCNLPIHIQKEYLLNLIKLYSTTASDLARMFGITAQTVTKHCGSEEIGIKFSPGKRMNKDNRAAFEIFCQGDNFVQKEEETVVAKKECGTDPVQRQDVFPIDRSIPAEMLMTELSMSFAGKFNREMIFNSIASMVPVGTPVKLDIKCFIVG